MAMSGKHYRYVAEILRTSIPDQKTEWSHEDVVELITEISVAMAKMFGEDSERFDRDKFMGAIFGQE